MTEPAGTTEPEAQEHAPDLPLLSEPADGVPDPVVDQAGLAAAVRSLAAGRGPVGVDAERASGYRYSQRAYLVQLRRAGAGTFLLDPVGVPDLSSVGAAIADAEWILHAANQDLPCLAEVGMTPTRLFDTELAGRLLGAERVALGTMVQHHLGVRLEKGHSAADWSTRPLPHDWLVYAALDVELLDALRAALVTQLADAGKTEWAEQEFEAVRLARPAPPREDPWRRTSGIHGARSRRQLAAVRALWYARDEVASGRDIAPGRVLPDAAIIDAARRAPTSAQELAGYSVFKGPRQRRLLSVWFAALAEAQALPEDELPTPTMTGDGIPPASRWRDRDPVAAARLGRVRDAVASVATEQQVLAQNLLAGDVLRRLCWAPPAADVDAVSVALVELGARPWQIALTAAGLAAALADPQ